MAAETNRMIWHLTYSSDGRWPLFGDEDSVRRGSCFLDLVGARVVAGLKLAVGELLPRQRLSDYYAAIGRAPARALTDEQIRALGSHRIVTAAAASLAAPVALRGRELVVVDARRTAAHLCRLVGLASAEARSALGVTRQGLAKLQSADLAPPALSAVRVRLALEEAATQTGSAQPPAVVVAGAIGRTG